MTDKKLSALGAVLGADLVGGDLFYVVAGGVEKKILKSELASALGGGSTGKEACTGGATIAAATTVGVDWMHSAGDALLDFGSPSLPVAIAAGWYAVHCSAEPNGPPIAGAYATVELELDGAGFPQRAWNSGPLFNDGQGSGMPVGVTVVAYVPVGGHFTAYVSHTDGSSQAMSTRMTIAKIA